MIEKKCIIQYTQYYVMSQNNHKMKYQYPLESPDTDKLDSLPDVPPLRETWHVALNDMSLYAVYLNEKKAA